MQPIDTFSVVNFSDMTANGDLDAAAVDAQIDAFLLTADGAGYTKAGSAAGNDLVISRTDGQDMEIVETNGLGSGGFDAAEVARDSTCRSQGR